MVRDHPSHCDCERCHPSQGILPFLMNLRAKKRPIPDTLYARRKKQERRVAEELQKWSEEDSQSTSNARRRVTRSGRSAPMTVSSEAIIVVQNIIERFKDLKLDCFTHLEIQIMFFWHTYQAMAGETMDSAVPMMITGVLTPYATDMELQDRATKMLRSDRNHSDRNNLARAHEFNELTRQLAANGADLRMWDALAHGTIFIFKDSNVAVAQIDTRSPSMSTSPVKGISNEAPAQMTQSLVVREEASPTLSSAMEVSQMDTRIGQLEEENCFLTERIYYLEDERAQSEEEWALMERRHQELEAENRRLRNLLEASLQIFTEPWESLKDEYGS